MTDLKPDVLTWTGLLGQWVQFAQAALALPAEADGPRWRASVPAIINLQAVTFALADLDRLPHDERALAIDKAELLVTSGTGELQRIWGNEIRLPMLLEIIADAHAALAVRVGRRFDPRNRDSVDGH